MLRTFSSDRRGAAIVEFTIVLPFLLVLGLGVFEFGNLLYGYHVITTGLRDSARFLARHDDPMTVQQKAKELAVYGEIGGTTRRLSWWNVGDITVTPRSIPNETRTYRGPDEIKIVKVSTNTVYPGLGLFSVIGLAPTLTFSTFHEERVIGD